MTEGEEMAPNFDTWIMKNDSWNQWWRQTPWYRGQTKGNRISMDGKKLRRKYKTVIATLILH